MHIDEIITLSTLISKKIKGYYGNKIGSTCVEFDEGRYDSFEIEFILFNYCAVIMRYEADVVSFFVEICKDVKVKVIEEPIVYSKSDFEKILNTLQKEVEIRIPDKYLLTHNWK